MYLHTRDRNTGLSCVLQKYELMGKHLQILVKCSKFLEKNLAKILNKST